MTCVDPRQLEPTERTAKAPALSTPARLRLIACPRPFLSERVDIEIPAGGTVEEIVRAAGVDRALMELAQVWLVDRNMTAEPVWIARAAWARVRRLAHASHVGVVVAPGWMLHVETGIDAALERYREGAWPHQTAGIYRWEGAR